MEYVWFVVIGVVVGLVSGRFLQGNNFGVRGDIVFGIIGALLFGVGLSATFASPEIVTGGKAVMAGMGAVLALVLRRVLKSV